MNRLFNKAAPQNVHGWERAASLASGLMLIRKGLRRGGLGGIVHLAMGGMTLARGISGRCEAKRMLTENTGHRQNVPQHNPVEKQRYAHMPLDSEVHSPDFEEPQATMPDTTPMGHETHPGEGDVRR